MTKNNNNCVFNVIVHHMYDKICMCLVDLMAFAESNDAGIKSTKSNIWVLENSIPNGQIFTTIELNRIESLLSLYMV